jgi:hypothetical protein
MKIPTQLEYLPSDNLGSFFQRLQKAWNQLCSAVNGQLSFGTTSPNGTPLPGNMKGQMVITGTPVSPNVEFQVIHNLGYVPLGYLVIQRNANCVIYNGTTAWTGQSIFLKCSTASAEIILFVLG